MLLSLWETGSAPYMQALHFFFGLGAFFAPLIAEPFLTSHAEFKVNGTSTNKKAPAFIPLNHTKSGPSIANSIANDLAVKGNGSLPVWSLSSSEANISSAIPMIDEFSRKSVAASIQIPYIVIMAWMVALGLAFWQLAIAHKLSGTESPFNKRTHSSSTDDGGPVIKTVTKWTTICIMSVFFFFYVGMEVSNEKPMPLQSSDFVLHSYFCFQQVAFGQLVFTFGVTSKAGMDKEEAAYVNSAYWGAYTAMRLASICIAIFVPPLAMMGANFGMVTVAAAVLVTYAETKVGLWVGTALLGIGFASVFPTGIMW